MKESANKEGCEQAWRHSIATIASSGRPYTDQEGRPCVELVNHLITVANASDAKRLVERLRLGLPWLYPSSDELRSVFFSMTSIASGYSYAPRLFGEVDQIDGFVIPLLQHNPESRRAVIVPYDPLIDSRLESSDIPSVLAITVRCQKQGLALTATLRSVDAFIGLPANLYQLRCLQEYIAQRLAIPCAELSVFCSNVHWLPEYEEVAKRLGVLLAPSSP